MHDVVDDERMERKPLKRLFLGALILLIGLCLTSIVLSRIVPKRKIVVDVTGETGETISVTIVVDDITVDATKELPARFEYHATHVLVEAYLSDPESRGQISASLFVNDEDLGTVGVPAGKGVRIGFKGSGLLGLGKKVTLISGISATDVAARRS